MKRLPFLAAAVALLLGSCAPTANETTPVAAAASPALKVVNGRIDANPALWVVKDADTTIYLFGTVHVLRADIDWFDGAVKRAYDASGELVLEVVAPDPAASQKVVMAVAVDPDGPPLSQKLDPALRARYFAAMKKAELPAAQLEKLEPWFVATLLGTAPLEKLGYTPTDGAETVLNAAAAKTGKPIAGLETFDQQLGFLDGLPEPVQIKFLSMTIDEMATADKTFAELVESWARGDADRLAGLMNEGMRDIPSIGKILLTDRNAHWAQWVDDRLDRPGTTFVAVGAGHLAGSDSLQAMLAKRGIKAMRIQ